MPPGTVKNCRSCFLAYCRTIDPELVLDSKRKETLHEFLEVLRELVVRDSATVEEKPQQSTDKKQCENIYFEGFRHFKPFLRSG